MPTDPADRESGASRAAPYTLGRLLAALRGRLPVGEQGAPGATSLSPTIVAQELGIARSYIYQLESDERHPSAPLMGRLLDYYQAGVADRAMAWHLLATAPPLHEPAEDPA